MQQGANIFATRNSAPVYSRLGLSGSVQIEGIPCFSKGVPSTIAPSNFLLEGSRAVARFVMDDGSIAEFQVTIVDAKATQLAMGALIISGGQCNGFYGTVPNPFILQK